MKTTIQYKILVLTINVLLFGVILCSAVNALNIKNEKETNFLSNEDTIFNYRRQRCCIEQGKGIWISAFLGKKRHYI